MRSGGSSKFAAQPMESLLPLGSGSFGSGSAGQCRGAAVGAF
jgi:hypothetical protein